MALVASKPNAGRESGPDGPQNQTREGKEVLMALKTKRGKGKWPWWPSKPNAGRENGSDGPQNQTREGKEVLMALKTKRGKGKRS